MISRTEILGIANQAAAAVIQEVMAPSHWKSRFLVEKDRPFVLSSVAKVFGPSTFSRAFIYFRSLRITNDIFIDPHEFRAFPADVARDYLRIHAINALVGIYDHFAETRHVDR